jgi:hypothetical protein
MRMWLGVNVTHWNVGKSIGPALMSEQFQHKHLNLKRGPSIECMMFREHNHDTKLWIVEGEACRGLQCCNSHFSKHLACVQLSRWSLNAHILWKWDDSTPKKRWTQFSVLFSQPMGHTQICDAKILWLGRKAILRTCLLLTILWYQYYKQYLL